MLGSLEDIEANVEGEKDGGKDSGCDGDMDGTISGGDVDLSQVKAVRLTAESQQTRNNARTQQNDLPVPPGQPANPRTPFYGLPRTSRRCRTIKFEPRNIRRTHKVKIAYLGRAVAISVLKSSPVQSFCPNFRQLETGLVAKFLKTRQLATELVATSCNQSFKRPVQDC